MKVDERASQDVQTTGGVDMPPRAGLASSALPEAQSRMPAENLPSGVSTRNALPVKPPGLSACGSPSRWYVLRATYGREKQAYDYMTAKGITAFHPTIRTVKLVKGKRKTVTESRFPNIFFAYGTEATIKSFVYGDPKLSYLRFYYVRCRYESRLDKKPLTVPDNQMESLRIVCAAEEADVIIAAKAIEKFEKGNLVVVKEGQFAGFTGRVARYQGQQRVGIVINELATICTAYVPNAFLKKIEQP